MPLSLRLEKYYPYALALLRIMIGLLFFEHGTQKILSFPIPFSPPVVVGSLDYVAGWLELIGGALITLGLFTRITAFLLSGEMAVGYFMMKAPLSFWPVVNGGEITIIFCFVFFFFIFSGPGAFSLDGWRAKRKLQLAN